MDSPRDLSRRLDEAAATFTTTAGALAAVAPASSHLGVDGPGRLGELGRALHGQATGAIDARVREAVAAAHRLTETAAALRQATESYADTDEAARRRQAEEA